MFRSLSPSVRHETRVEFLGEQGGASERELKSAIVELLPRFPSVRRAYLARVGFQPDGRTSIAVCLVAGKPNKALVRQIDGRFKALFAEDTFVDILFLSDEQDEDAARVCAAFYSRPV